MHPVLLIPGLHNSGPEHWQSLWEASHRDFRRVQQKDWDSPRCSDWIQTLDYALSAAGGPFVLAAHSLACATVAHWAAKFPHNGRVHTALLVGPSDVEAPTYPPGTEGFTPMPMRKLPFRSVVIASTDDPYVTLQRAQAFATAWGSEFVNIGGTGHINTASGHGPFPQGEEWLAKLRG